MGTPINIHAALPEVDEPVWLFDLGQWELGYLGHPDSDPGWCSWYSGRPVYPSHWMRADPSYSTLPPAEVPDPQECEPDNDYPL